MVHKFENIDVIASLGAIMRGNTAYHQKDFNIDTEIMRDWLQKAVGEPTPLLWLRRPSGTHLFPERNVFIKDTRAYNTWVFFGEETRDLIRAYAVELTGTDGGKLMGNLFELDYDAHSKHVKETALPAAYVHITFGDGHDHDFTFEQYTSPWNEIYWEHGKVQTIEYSSHSEGELHEVLEQERRERQSLPFGIFKNHLLELSDRKVLAEAQRIQRELKALQWVNSPSGTHYMVELSPAFLLTANDSESDKVFRLLPYKTLSISGFKEKSGIFALISKNESRDQPLRLPKPSVRKKLESKRMAPTLPPVKHTALER